MKINGKQVFSQGGFSSHVRVHEQFVFNIPDEISSEEAGPMMCAGLTTFSPLVRGGVGPDSKVAIVGIGGLGHFGILWAKGLGAHVTALSHSANKEKSARELGVDDFVLTTDKDWAVKHKMAFDFILNCSNATHSFDLATYLSTLNVGGTFHHVGLPNEPLPQIPATAFVRNNCKMAGSHIGSRREAEQMLKLAAEKSIHPRIETLDISEANAGKGVEKVANNEARYRLVLTGFHEAFGT